MLQHTESRSSLSTPPQTAFRPPTTYFPFVTTEKWPRHRDEALAAFSLEGLPHATIASRLDNNFYSYTAEDVTNRLYYLARQGSFLPTMWNDPSIGVPAEPGVDIKDTFLEHEQAEIVLYLEDKKIFSEKIFRSYITAARVRQAAREFDHVRRNFPDVWRLTLNMFRPNTTERRQQAAREWAPRILQEATPANQIVALHPENEP